MKIVRLAENDLQSDSEQYSIQWNLVNSKSAISKTIALNWINFASKKCYKVSFSLRQVCILTECKLLHLFFIERTKLSSRRKPRWRRGSCETSASSSVSLSNGFRGSPPISTGSIICAIIRGSRTVGGSRRNTASRKPRFRLRISMKI